MQDRGGGRDITAAFLHFIFVATFGNMTDPEIPTQYTLPVSRSDWPVLLADWQSLIPQGSSLWLLTKFGDLFFTQPDEKIGMLQVSGFLYSVVANDQTDFREWLADPDKMSEWFLAPLVDRMDESGRLLGAGQCYSFVKALCLGGTPSAANVAVIPVENHFAAGAGYFARSGVCPQAPRLSRKDK